MSACYVEQGGILADSTDMRNFKVPSRHTPPQRESRGDR
jgi:hypothetical protein